VGELKRMKVDLIFNDITPKKDTTVVLEDPSNHMP